jgi:chemotaxis protein histidine kinase CheA
MNTDLIPNEKQLASRIEKAESRVDRSLKTFIDDCIFLGEEIIEVRKNIPHGQWEKFLNRNSHFRFATSRQASKFIRIAENKTFAKTFLIGETSIDGLNKGIADATPEQLEKAEQLQREEEAKRQQAEAEKQRKAAELQAQKAAKKEPEIIEGELKEVKSDSHGLNPSRQTEKAKQADPVDSEEVEQLRDLLSEQMSVNAAIQQDNDSLVRVFESNDKLAQATTEIKRLNEVNRALQDRLNGALNTEAEMKRTIRYWEGRCKKLEKQLEASNASA